MSPEVAGTLLIVLLFVLLATGMPIAFALGLAAISALFVSEGTSVFPCRRGSRSTCGSSPLSKSSFRRAWSCRTRGT